eukprot:scaffold1404_cov166-Amphora_coffeaeformis.AAC.1
MEYASGFWTKGNNLVEYRTENALGNVFNLGRLMMDIEHIGSGRENESKKGRYTTTTLRTSTNLNSQWIESGEFTLRDPSIIYYYYNTIPYTIHFSPPKVQTWKINMDETTILETDTAVAVAIAIMFVIPPTVLVLRYPLAATP